ncbi:MAG: hypothetical protein ACREJG_07010 [Candidatus Rokuibacteriota bacterium]
MITGSVVSSLQGEPRATHDIDVVVAVHAPAAAVAAALKAAFPEPDFYLDEATVRDAIMARAMFNLIDTREGDKTLRRRSTPCVPARRHDPHEAPLGCDARGK